MEKGTIGGNFFSLPLGRRNPRRTISPSFFITETPDTLDDSVRTKLLEDLGGGCFGIRINKTDGSEIASAKINKDTGEILEMQPKNREERLKIFEIMFRKNMLNFSDSYGMLPLDLVLCISMLYGDNDNLRLFFQQIYFFIHFLLIFKIIIITLKTAKS